MDAHSGPPVDFRALDVPADGIPASDDLIRTVKLWRPDVVGFSCHYWSTATFCRQAAWIKQLLPHTLVILGGPHVGSEAAAQEALERYPEVDYVIRGDGERPVCELLDSVGDGRSGVIDIPGLSYRGDAGLRHNPVADRCLSERPPVFHASNTYLRSRLHDYSEVSCETVIGCRSKCVYCMYRGTGLDFLNDDVVEGELAFVCEQDVPHLRICDAHFGGTRQRAKRFLRHLARVNRQTRVRIYPDLLHIDDEYLALARRAGAEMTSIGIQSTNPQCLARIGRPPMHDRKEEIRLVLESFPDVPADVIVGLPGDDPAGMEQTFSDVLEMGFGAVNVFYLRVFPGTELADRAIDYLGDDIGPVTEHCQVVDSPVYSDVADGRVERLVCGLEIVCPLRRSRAHLAEKWQQPVLAELLRRLNREELLDISAQIGEVTGTQQRVDTEPLMDRLARALGDTLELREHLAADLRQLCNRERVE